MGGQRIGGSGRKTRKKLKKRYYDKGKISITRYTASFKKGERVTLLTEPAVQKARFHPRFYSRSGLIEGKRGNCYIVKIKDGGKEKRIITLPVHLKKMKS